MQQIIQIQSKLSLLLLFHNSQLLYRVDTQLSEQRRSLDYINGVAVASKIILQQLRDAKRKVVQSQAEVEATSTLMEAIERDKLVGLMEMSIKGPAMCVASCSTCLESEANTHN